MIKLSKKNNNFNKLVLIFSFFLIVFFVVLTFFPKKNNNIQLIKTKLITNVHKDLPMEFKSDTKNVSIIPGEVRTINYVVKNTSNEIISGIAVFQVYPSELEPFITKLNCFCHEKQTFKSGQENKYSLVLLVDPKVIKNNNTKNIKEAIIQFTFFKKWY